MQNHTEKIVPNNGTPPNCQIIGSCSNLYALLSDLPSTRFKSVLRQCNHLLEKVSKLQAHWCLRPSVVQLVEGLKLSRKCNETQHSEHVWRPCFLKVHMSLASTMSCYVGPPSLNSSQPTCHLDLQELQPESIDQLAGKGQDLSQTNSCQHITCTIFRQARLSQTWIGPYSPLK